MKDVPFNQKLSTGIGTRVPPLQIDRRDVWRGGLPIVSLAGILIWTVILQPNALSYAGLNLLLSSTVPLIFATIAQMFVIAVGDIDLGIGAFVGLVNVVGATYLHDRPALGVGLYILFVLLYMAMGALVHLRRLPSIIVTLGASFVWLGAALLILPTPGGQAPEWLQSVFNYNPPLVPLPILIAVVVATVCYVVVMRTGYGVVLRGIGGNPEAVSRAGWSLLRFRITLYGLAGLFGVLGGLAVTASTTSGDANASASYTLLTIAAVILGGGEFSGGVVAPVGAVIGTITIALVGSLLAFLNVSPEYQSGVQGAILIVVLAGRALARRDKQ